MKPKNLGTGGRKADIDTLVERSVYLSSLLTLSTATIIMIVRLEHVKYEARLLLACLVPSLMLLLGILGAVLRPSIKDVNILRLALKLIVSGVIMMHFRLGKDIFTFKELLFYGLQANCLRISAGDSTNYRLTASQISDYSVWLLTGVVCIVFSLDDWLTCLNIGLSCLGLIVQILAQLLRPKVSTGISINVIDTSPVEPTEMMSNRLDMPGLNLISPERMIQIRPAFRGLSNMLSRKDSERKIRRSTARKSKLATDLLRNAALIDNSVSKSKL